MAQPGLHPILKETFEIIYRKLLHILFNTLFFLRSSFLPSPPLPINLAGNRSKIYERCPEHREVARVMRPKNGSCLYA